MGVFLRGRDDADLLGSRATESFKLPAAHVTSTSTSTVLHATTTPVRLSCYHCIWLPSQQRVLAIPYCAPLNQTDRFLRGVNPHKSCCMMPETRLHYASSCHAMAIDESRKVGRGPERLLLRQALHSPDMTDIRKFYPLIATARRGAR